MNQNNFSAYQRYLAFQKFWHAFNKGRINLHIEQYKGEAKGFAH